MFSGVANSWTGAVAPLEVCVPHIHKALGPTQAWWHMPVIHELRKQRKANHTFKVILVTYKLEASLGYMRSRLQMLQVSDLLFLFVLPPPFIFLAVVKLLFTPASASSA